MARIQVDYNTTPGHIFSQSARLPTFMHGNGLGHVFAPYASEINAGITPTKWVNGQLVPDIPSLPGHPGDHYLRVYAAGSLVDPGSPASVTYGHWPLAIRNDMTPKVVHWGYGQEAKSAGPTTFILHGPSPDMKYMAEFWMDPTKDTFIFDHSKHSRAEPDGIGIDKVRGDWLNDDVFRIKSVEGHGTSANAFIHQGGDQHFRMFLNDDGRNAFHPVDIQPANHSEASIEAATEALFHHWAHDGTIL